MSDPATRSMSGQCFAIRFTLTLLQATAPDGLDGRPQLPTEAEVSR